MSSTRTRLIAALDTASYEEATQWATQLEGKVDAIKLGLEFTYACGLDAVRALGEHQKLFLDLKLHDIPNTVASGLKALAPLRPFLTTIHALGGPEMIARARAALEESFEGGPDRPKLLAVTVLTSMNEQSLAEVGINDTPLDEVVRLGKMAIQAGADGLVCSAHELVALRDALGNKPELIVPGIRPAGSALDDQKRVMSPTQAAEAGADWIVVGRPITRADDPAAAAQAIQDELQAASQ
ncbi:MULTISPECIES: orotidine-5'-phosphate decarboxylase [Bombella]|uniref:Orotidine 5'-phosphate decarboxylase n=1 Tax=Bombella pollinis TaxID=2967337 RepID=A0ABT3WMT0_9PROT|nr:MULTISPECIES: orotidine-5'-phosphate decarboxylase [Bombella]MCX5620480.1 orotidine-5'-phosphate decarboxylase [Bombella pollinis]MUG04636.1 orotidine-5'-phosphate decarboxylase [Bombella sp. ESL0378]MUG90176.1 orotidine-5'-phosphate decarboxylase [Bombella sp. ESL0385]